MSEITVAACRCCDSGAACPGWRGGSLWVHVRPDDGNRETHIQRVGSSCQVTVFALSPWWYYLWLPIDWVFYVLKMGKWTKMVTKFKNTPISRPTQVRVRQRLSFLHWRVLSCPLSPFSPILSESTNLEKKAIYGLHPEVWPTKLTMDM